MPAGLPTQKQHPQAIHADHIEANIPRRQRQYAADHTDRLPSPQSTIVDFQRSGHSRADQPRTAIARPRFDLGKICHESSRVCNRDLLDESFFLRSVASGFRRSPSLSNRHTSKASVCLLLRLGEPSSRPKCLNCAELHKIARHIDSESPTNSSPLHYVTEVVSPYSLSKFFPANSFYPHLSPSILPDRILRFIPRLTPG